MSEERMLELRLLGSPQINVDGAPVNSVAWAKSQALLFYLALSRRPLSRLSLAGLLWPDKSDEEARTTLRQALRTVTKALPDAIEATQENLALNQTDVIQVDVLAFEADAQAGLAGDLDALRRAADRYSGDFLVGFYVDDAPDFEEWMLYTRERLHGLALQVLHQLSVHHVQRREVGPGLIYTQRLLALEPWREETHQQLMRLFAWDGQFSAALAQYQSCRRLLDEELGAPPSPETTALRDRIERLRTARRHNLPPEPTPLVGRKEEIASVSQSVQQSGDRLTTILGPGGIGKTRLALAVAQRLMSIFLEGVFWVDLNAVSTLDGLITALAGALHLTLSGKADPQQQVLNYLRDKELLLVLDNFEHLLDDANPEQGAASTTLIQRFLQQAPALSLLVTSRVQLAMRQERLFTLAPLAYPPQPEAPDSTRYAAVQLFTQVAQRVDQGFDPTIERTCVANICRLVEGLPLGVELAAALVQTQPCAAIAAAITANLDTLSTRWRDLPPRQRSLRATFDYSLSLLPPAARQLLYKLAVFHDGFTQDAARSIAAATPDLLATLIAHSLVQRVQGERYRLHEVIRQFAHLSLAQTPSAEQEVQRSHGLYFTSQVQRQEALLRRDDPPSAQHWFASELNNVRAAWRWAVEAGDVSSLAGVLGGLMLYYQRNGPYIDAEHLLKSAVSTLSARLAPTSGDRNQWERTLGHLLVKQAEMVQSQGRSAEAIAVLQQCFRLSEALPDQTIVAEARCIYCQALYTQGELDAALEQARQAERLAAAAQQLRLVAVAQSRQGEIARLRGDPQRAIPLFESTLGFYQAEKDLGGIADTRNQLGLLYFDLNAMPQARAMLTECYDLAKRLGDRDLELSELINLGIIHDYYGEYDRSRANYEAARLLAEQMGNRDMVYSALTNAGLAAQLIGDFATAHEHYQQVLRGLHTTPGHHQEGLILANLALLAHQTGDQAAALRYSLETIRLAETLASLFLKAYGLTFAGHANTALGNLAEAAKNYQEAVKLRREMGAINMAMESLAGLARSLLAQNKPRAALQQVEEIQRYLTEQPQAEGTDEPLRLYLTCYQVLKANRDSRAANILSTAHQLLQERAARLHDDTMRHSFLHQIVTHQMLLDEYR